MKTVTGQCVSLKEISLSKAAKILSKFVSADNGASHVISTYLHRASASFTELDQLHKEIKASNSHKKKRKRHRAEGGDESGRVVENSIWSVETNNVKSNELRKQWIGGENDEKSTQTVVKLSQELNGSIGDKMGNVGGSEKHKKNKKRKLEVDSRDDEDSRVKFGESEDDEKLSSRVQNELESGQEQGGEGDGNTGMEEQKKQKREKKKHREGTFKFSGNKGEVENLEGENAKEQQLKGIEKKLCNGVEDENGGLVGYWDLQIEKKKNYDTENENKLYDEEVKTEQRKKKKNEHVEGRPEERSGDQTKKRMKRKHEGDL